MRKFTAYESDNFVYQLNVFVNSTSKIIILVDEDTWYMLENTDDLHTLYNDWLNMNSDLTKSLGGHSPIPMRTVQTMEDIREWHNEIWESIPAGIYKIEQFEGLATASL
jgi:hypothetical protein